VCVRGINTCVLWGCWDARCYDTHTAISTATAGKRLFAHECRVFLLNLAMVSAFTVLVVADSRPNPPPVWIAYVVGAVIALICMRSVMVEVYQMRVYRRVYVDTWNIIDLAVVSTTAGVPHECPL
jgi:hypothetical protein